MTRRLLAALAACLLLAALPASASGQQPVAPAGTTIIVVFQSTGTELVPVGQAVIPPLACSLAPANAS